MKRSLSDQRVWLLQLMVLPSLLLMSPWPFLLRGDAADVSSQKQIERWIEDLGSDQFAVRELATRALKERQDAVPALNKALTSPDLELRRRAIRILRALKAKHARRILAQAYALGKGGRIVEAVDRIVYWREWDTDNKGWDTLTRFASKLLGHANNFQPGEWNSWKTPGLPAGDFRRYYEAKMPNSKPNHPKEFSGRKIVNPHAHRLIARGEQVIIERGKGDLPITAYSIIAASEDVRTGIVDVSLIIAGGDIKTDGAIEDSILVCDGNVDLQQPPLGGLIVARGKVTCRNRKLIGCVIRAENYYQFRDGKRIIIKDGTPDPVGFVKFFEFADVGLSASDRDQKEASLRDGVRLKDVRKDSPFASGLRSGDVVTALDETKTISPEVFRKILRRKLGGIAPVLTFTVRRAGKKLDVPIALKD